MREWTEEYARKVIEIDPAQAPGVGLHADIPDDWPGHVIRPGLRLKRWPTVYLTPRVRLYMQLHETHAAGIALRGEPGMLWPAPLAQAMRAITRERQIAERP